jgi:hypothetical protein
MAFSQHEFFAEAGRGRPILLSIDDATGFGNGRTVTGARAVTPPRRLMEKRIC